MFSLFVMMLHCTHCVFHLHCCSCPKITVGVRSEHWITLINHSNGLSLNTLWYIQSWVWAAHPYCRAYFNSAFYPRLYGTISISFRLNVVMVDVVTSGFQMNSWLKSISWVWWLVATWQSIHQINWVISHNGCAMMSDPSHCLRYCHHSSLLLYVTCRNVKILDLVSELVLLHDG